MDMQYEKYKALLDALNPMLADFFENQKEYIHCKLRCSHCCQRGYYPVTEVESKFIKEGFDKLDESLKTQIYEKAVKIANERKMFVENGNDILQFKYCCPFLTDDLCSIYEHRPIICRTQGLIHQSAVDEQKFNVPGCMHLGLNYANVWDEKINFFTQKKIDELNLSTPPIGFDFSYESLVEMCGVESATLPEKLVDPENNEIRMIFEWVL